MNIEHRTLNIECLMRKDERHLLKLVWYWLFAFHSTLDVGRTRVTGPMFDVHLSKPFLASNVELKTKNIEY